MSLDYALKMIEVSQKGRDALNELAQQARAYAVAEQAYRKAKSQAILQATGTAIEKQAVADQACADLRFQRDLADGLRQSALEAVRTLRAELSALQTLSNREAEEMKFARTGPEEGGF